MLRYCMYAFLFSLFVATLLPATSKATNAGDFPGAVAIGSSYSGTPAPTNGLMVQGNVGIGTTAPQNQFEDYGDGQYLAVRAASAAGRTLLGAQSYDYWSAPTYLGVRLRIKAHM